MPMASVEEMKEEAQEKGSEEEKRETQNGGLMDSMAEEVINEVDYWDDGGDDLITDADGNIFDITPTTVLRNRGKVLVDKVRKRFKTAPVVKMRDKLSYFFGVWSVIALVFIFGNAPSYFAIAYGTQFFTLLPIRFYLYKKLKFHYFMFDFCYFANFLLFFFLFVWKDVDLFRICFAFSSGPLPVAILAWKNSLVFHSLDKLTSVFIHIGPAIQVYLVRWVFSEEYLGCKVDECEATLVDILIVPVGVYLLWQIMYFLKVEVFSVEKVRSKGYVTSSVWMIDDPKSTFNSILPKRFQQSRQTKMLGFMSLQFLYTFLSLFPSVICWYSHDFHAFFLLFFIAVSIWNGGSFYFEVFAVRYMKSLQDAVEKEMADEDN